MAEIHFSQLISYQARKYGDRTALCYRNDEQNKWISISWNEFDAQVRNTARALYDSGVQEEQNIGIFSQNKPECFYVDFALYANRAVAVPMYATSTAEQIEYIVNDAHIDTIFVGEQYQYDTALTVLKRSAALKKIIVFDNTVKIESENSLYFADFLKTGETSASQSEVDARTARATAEDVATLMYTSGTTGEPKGVVLPHSCFLEAMRIHPIRLPFMNENDTSLCFLPLTHIFERAWSYLCLTLGVVININLRPAEIQRAVSEVRPTMMCSVPRFWEKVYAGIQEKIEGYSPVMVGVVAWAIAVGKKYNIKYLRENKRPPRFLRWKYRVADKFVFSKVKETLGIENGVMFPTAGAALSENICQFFRAIGVPITIGYGLTESCATVCCFDRTDYVFDSAGKIMPDIQVKIGADNEILLKGKTIFREYYNKPEANAQAFTADGWFRTGDAGKIEGDTLFITERLKDLFKTSNGKYIAPQQIETRLAADKYIEQAAVIGDQRNYVTALIVPKIQQLQEYAKDENIACETIEDLLKLPKIYDFIADRVREAQKGMATYEQIKKFSLIAKDFSLEGGELTNTLKIKRMIISEKYKKLIDAMYKN
ncbi:long-chain-fatty-acid--CoA ligase [Bacteroidia bacterium]|nr:long-chain-fatty-acid--CoA ligase [Bacteroidia bacterium]